MASRNAIIAVAVVAIVVVACVAVYMTSSGDEDPTTDSKMKDFVGQEIIPVENLDNGIVAVGQDTFRWVTYFGLESKCVMVDQNDMTNYLGKAFMYDARSQVDIEGGSSALLTSSDEAREYFTHTNCGITSYDVRTIIDLAPSIVVVPQSFYTDYRNEMNTLEKNGINTVAIGYIYTFLDKDLEITDALERQIDVLSYALGQEDHGVQIKAAFDTILDDLKDLRSKISETRTGYVGSIAYNGAHGMNSSLQYYMPFELAGIKNIIGGDPEYKDSDVKEYSAAVIGNAIRDDTILFVDASGYSINTDNTSKGIIGMFVNHDAYLLAPYIWTGINYENVFVDAYQILRYAYGDSVITQSEFDERIDRVYELFLGTSDSSRDISVFKAYTCPIPEEGTSIFEDMNAMYLVAKGNPIHGELTVGTDGTLSYQ